MPEVARLRSLKIHPWTNPSVLARFESVRTRLGFSRDGAIETAMIEYTNKHGRKADERAAQ